MDNNFRNWVLLFRCFCALVMCASFFTIMIPAAIVQNYFVGTTCGAIIRQSNEQVSEGIVPPQQIIHPANVTSQDESDYVTVALFAFIAGGMVLATVLQATDTQHAIVTALFAGGYFVLSTIQISLKLRPAREARPLDPSTITQIFDAPVMEGPFCQTFVLQDSEGINAETWTCSLASVLQGDVRQSEQRACNSSIASRWIATTSCFAALLCTLTAVWYFAGLLHARYVPEFRYKKAVPDPAENEVLEMS